MPRSGTDAASRRGRQPSLKASARLIENEYGYDSPETGIDRSDPNNTPIPWIWTVPPH